jgi:hypothetical protein
MNDPIFYDSLTTYNTAHEKYLQCLNSDNVDCSQNYLNLNNSYQDLSNNLSKLYLTLNSIPREKHVDIKKMFDENNVLRSELETKLQDLYGMKNMTANDSNINTNSSISANLVWTVLATTFLYYIIVKL